MLWGFPPVFVAALLGIAEISAEVTCLKGFAPVGSR